MVRPQATDGRRPLLWWVAANVLNKQSQTANKRWSSSLGVRRGAKKSSPSKPEMLQNIIQGLGLGRMGNMDWIDLAQDRNRWMALMNLRVP